MAQEIVGIKVEVDSSDVGKSVGSLKQQLRQAQNDVTVLSEKFGATSKEAIEAAKRAAQLKDAIGDAKALTDAFNPDAKFKALSSTLSGVAGGFAAVQGALGLLGQEGEDVQKTLVKVQSALALSQGLQTVGESIDSFKQLGAVIKNSVSTAFGSLRSAIISTGIGALVVALGLLIANFDTVKKVVLNLFPGLGKLAGFVQGLVQKFTDFVGVTSESGRQLDALKAKTDRNAEAIQNRIKVLQAQGGKEKEIYELTKRLADDELSFLKKKASSEDQLTKEEAKRYRELNNEKAVLDAAEQRRLNELEEARRKKAQEAREQREKEELEHQERLKKIVQDFNEAEDKINEQRKKDAIEAQRKQDEEDAAEMERIAEEQTKKDNEEYERQNKIKLKALQDQKALDEAELKSTRELQEAKFAAVSGGLQLLAGLVSENEKIANALFVADKALAIGKIIVDTQREIAGIAAANAPLGPLGIPVTAAQITAAKIRAGIGIATITAATIAKFKKGSASVGGSGNVPAPSAAPIAPVAPQAQLTQLNQQSINQLGSATSRAYVLESDVTNSQEKITRINRAARLG